MYVVNILILLNLNTLYVDIKRFAQNQGAMGKTVNGGQSFENWNQKKGFTSSIEVYRTCVNVQERRYKVDDN